MPIRLSDIPDEPIAKSIRLSDISGIMDEKTYTEPQEPTLTDRLRAVSTTRAKVGLAPIESTFEAMPAKMREAITGTEEKIAGRQDILKGFTEGEDAQKLLSRSLAERITRSPLTGLGLISGATQRAEAAISNVLMELQRPTVDPEVENARGIQAFAQDPELAIKNDEIQREQIKQLWQAFKSGITGERLGNAGDVVRNAGGPEWLASSVGFMALAAATDKAFSSVRAIKSPNYKKIIQTISPPLEKAGKNLQNVVATKGRAAGKKVIEITTGGVHPEAIDNGMNKGWDVVLNKKNLDVKIPLRKVELIRANIDKIDDIDARTFAKNNFGTTEKFIPAPVDKTIPYKATLKVKEGLKVSLKDARTRYGDTFDNIAESVKGNFPEGVPIPDVIANFKRSLIRERLIDNTGKELKTLAMRTPQEDTMLALFDKFKDIESKGGNVPFDELIKLKKGLWQALTKQTLTGEMPVSGKEHLISELIGNLGDKLAPVSDELVALNAEYKVFRDIWNPANKIFKPFKGIYKTEGGEKIFNNYDSLPTGQKELVKALDDILPKDYKFMDDLTNFGIAKNQKILTEREAITTGENLLNNFYRLAEGDKKKLINLNNSLPKNAQFLDDIKDWNTAHEMLSNWVKGKAVYPSRPGILQSISKPIARGFLKYKTPVRKQIEPVMPAFYLRLQRLMTPEQQEEGD